MVSIILSVLATTLLLVWSLITYNWIRVLLGPDMLEPDRGRWFRVALYATVIVILAAVWR